MTELSDYKRIVEKPERERTQQRIDELLGRSANRRMALMKAREKLVLYRAQHSGEYIGGMEYTALLKLIDEAIG